MTQNTRTAMIAMAGVIILVAGCVPQSAPPPPTPTPTVTPTVPAEPATEAAPAEDAVEPTAVGEAPSEPATPRPGLAATDPSTVMLASGQPQLVEFFAFW